MADEEIRVYEEERAHDVSYAQTEHEEERAHDVSFAQIAHVEGTGEILEDHTSTGRAAPWAEKKQLNEALTRMYRAVNNTRARENLPALLSDRRMNDLESCGSYLEFGVNEQGEKRLHRANFCHVRLCPLCQWRRSLAQFHMTQQQADWIQEHHSGVRYIFLTVTLRNCQPAQLSQTIDALTRGFSLMVGSKRARVNSLRARLQGTLLGSSRSIEVTYNSSANTMHPHIHALLAVSPSYFTGAGYITHEGWQQLWRECVGIDYLPQVSIETIDNTARAVAECSKYSAKLTNILHAYAHPHDSEQAERALEAMHIALRGRRLISLSGCFKDAKAALRQQDADAREDLIHVDGDDSTFRPIEYHLYRWRACSGAYIC